MSSEYNLPAELLIDILTRLPLKTLLRCTSVSKSWYSLITSPNFITSHLNNNPTTHSNNFLMVGRSVKYSTKMYLSLHWDNDTFDEFAQFDFPLEYSTIVGTCNGLICLSGGRDEIMALWNPSLKKSVILPMHRVLCDSGLIIRPSIGFGIDPVTNDYKIVRLTYLWSNRVEELLPPPEVELFELSTSSWRSINAGDFPYVASPGDQHAVLNGVVHWIGHNPNKVRGIMPNLIVSFDMRNESLGVVMAPAGVPLQEVWDILTIFGESLSFFKEDVDHSWCLWVMKEYGIESSWTKQFTVDMRGVSGIPTCIRENGEILFERRYRPSKSRDAGLISYDPKTKLIKYLRIEGRVGSSYTDTYNESLVLIKGLNEVPGRKENSDGAVTCRGTSVLPREDDEVNGKSKKDKTRMKEE